MSRSSSPQQMQRSSPAGQAGRSAVRSRQGLALQPPGRERPLARRLPPGMSAPAGTRARTLEETAIDIAGEGSELNALVTSPLRTIGNALGGLFSRNPTRAQMRASPAVQAAISAAWAGGSADYCERFGWITYNPASGNFAVPVTAVGTSLSVTPPPKPADHVGEFHIHPPLDPGDPTMANPLDWPIGPSATDERAAQADHSPGIVRDFDTVARTGGVTDYTYGPWRKI
ncbi:MAG: hypothetical protein KBC73_06240 [Burkholderiaceae bacterium]|nr:hypothetical protein [Burkholderiaceae bacterium]